MTTITSLLVVAVAVFGIVAGVPTAGLALTPNDVVDVDVGQTDPVDANASELAPGERFSGVVGVQRAEFDGEMVRRTFDVQLDRAASDDAKATVLRERLETIDRRITELERAQRSLAIARERGNLSQGAYQARVATLAARAVTVQQSTAETESVRRDLPAAALERNGVDAAAIERLKRNASALTGPEVATIARSIGGPAVGAPIGPARTPGDAGPPGERGPPRPGDVPGPPPDGQEDGSTGNATSPTADPGPPAY